MFSEAPTWIGRAMLLLAVLGVLSLIVRLPKRRR